MIEALKKEGGLWNRWEVLAMSTNESHSWMRLHPIHLHSRFYRKPRAPLVFGLFGARVLAARLAGCTRSVLHPCTPHLCREFSKRRVSFPFFPHKNNEIPTLPHFQRDLHRDTRTTIPTPPRPASSGGPQLCFHFNDLNPNYHAAAGKRFMVEALKKEAAWNLGASGGKWEGRSGDTIR